MPFGPALLLTVPRPGPGAWPSGEFDSTREAHLCTPYSRELGYSETVRRFTVSFQPDRRSNGDLFKHTVCPLPRPLTTTLPPCPTTSQCQELSIPGKCPHVHSRQNELQNSIANAIQSRIQTALPIPPIFHSITQEKANVFQRSVCVSTTPGPSWRPRLHNPVYTLCCGSKPQDTHGQVGGIFLLSSAKHYKHPRLYLRRARRSCEGPSA